MKILYVTDVLLPSKFAHAIHFVKQCEGFADAENDVQLLHARKSYLPISDNQPIYEYYGVKNNFALISFPKYSFTGSKTLYQLCILRYLAKQGGLVYTRDKRIATFSVFAGLKTILELHSPLSSPGVKRSFFWQQAYAWALKSPKMIKVVVISGALKNVLASKVAANKILVAPDASNPPSTSNKIHLENRSAYLLEAGYTGHLYEGKGMEIIFKVAAILQNVRFHIIGGTEKDLNHWKQKAGAISNIVFYGYIPPRDISTYLNSFDVCLLPNQKTVKVDDDKLDIGEFTSPLKMFDYMAHSKPIVASDLPVLREVLNEQNSILCDPENPQEWVDAINALATDPALRDKLSGKAFADFEENYTWKVRARRIIASIF